MSYTLGDIVPVLAMIEDPAPPAYEPVSLNDDDAQSLPDDAAAAATVTADEAGAVSAAPVTSSLRTTLRTLRSVGGWKSFLRGFGCRVAAGLATSFVYGLMVSAYVPRLIAGPACAVALIQLHTAWVHVVISAPSPLPFWRRLPPFRRVFNAAALPFLAYFLALEVSTFVPQLLARVLGLMQWDKHTDQPGMVVPYPDGSDAWKAVVVFVVMAALRVFLAIPAHVVLTRVQASLLPEEDETIVAFDRSFRGRVEPAVVGGKGYVSPLDAWRTFSRASWVRLVKLYAKLFVVGLAVTFAWALVVVPELLVMFRYAKKIEE